ncbi:hypothetical protein NIES2101_01485 [Calothrix sp. HK-06]|nr:hypothetical protein NIES2101_01485 [Calothrix sp. HK-06]
MYSNENNQYPSPCVFTVPIVLQIPIQLQPEVSAAPQVCVTQNGYNKQYESTPAQEPAAY